MRIQRFLLRLLIEDLWVFVSLNLLLPFFLIKLFLGLDRYLLLLVVLLQVFFLDIQAINFFFQSSETLIHSF